MGYSANALAFVTLHAIEARCRTSTQSSNTWWNGDHRYFFEVGSENRNGAITGTVYKMTADSRCTRYGAFRIDSTGYIAKFPGLPWTRAMRREQKVAA